MTSTLVRRLADARRRDAARAASSRRATTARVFAAPQHPYTRMLIDAAPKGEPPPSDPDAPTIVSADDLQVWFPIRKGLLRRVVGHVKAVDGVRSTSRPGATLGVVGESGSGKTTLGLAILRLIRSEGPIAFKGARIDGLQPRRDAAAAARNADRVSGPVRLAVAAPVGRRHRRGGADRARARSSTRAARREAVARRSPTSGSIPTTMDRYPHEFSGGQRQRIAIARAMALDPKFVVLDEPTSALDKSVQAQIVDLLRDLQKRRWLAYLFITHDLEVVRALASDIVVMKAGRVVESGPAAQIFAAPREDYTERCSRRRSTPVEAIGRTHGARHHHRSGLRSVAAARATPSITATRAPIRSAISPSACAAGQGDRDGLRRGAAGAAQPRPARPRPRDARLDRAQAAGLRLQGAAGPMGLRRRDLARQGHAVGPLGDRRHAGRIRLGLFPGQDAGLSAGADARPDRARQADRHSRRLPRLGHRDHRALRRGASAHAEADLLHLRRFRAADRRARGGVRPRAALRRLPHRARLVRSAQHRPRDRAAVRRRQAGRSFSAPPTARISRCRRCPAICSRARRRRGGRSSPSARSATSSRIATPGAS